MLEWEKLSETYKKLKSHTEIIEENKDSKRVIEPPAVSVIEPPAASVTPPALTPENFSTPPILQEEEGETTPIVSVNDKKNDDETPRYERMLRKLRSENEIEEKRESTTDDNLLGLGKEDESLEIKTDSNLEIKTDSPKASGEEPDAIGSIMRDRRNNCFEARDKMVEKLTKKVDEKLKNQEIDRKNDKNLKNRGKAQKMTTEELIEKLRKSSSKRNTEDASATASASDVKRRRVDEAEVDKSAKNSNAKKDGKKSNDVTLEKNGEGTKAKAEVDQEATDELIEEEPESDEDSSRDKKRKNKDVNPFVDEAKLFEFDS